MVSHKYFLGAYDSLWFPFQNEKHVLHEALHPFRHPLLLSYSPPSGASLIDYLLLPHGVGCENPTTSNENDPKIVKEGVGTRQPKITSIPWSSTKHLLELLANYVYTSKISKWNMKNDGFSYDFILITPLVFNTRSINMFHFVYLKVISCTLSGTNSSSLKIAG